MKKYQAWGRWAIIVKVLPGKLPSEKHVKFIVEKQHVALMLLSDWIIRK